MPVRLSRLRWFERAVYVGAALILLAYLAILSYGFAHLCDAAKAAKVDPWVIGWAGIVSLCALDWIGDKIARLLGRNRP